MAWGGSRQLPWAVLTPSHVWHSWSPANAPGCQGTVILVCWCDWWVWAWWHQEWKGFPAGPWAPRSLWWDQLQTHSPAAEDYHTPWPTALCHTQETAGWWVQLQAVLKLLLINNTYKVIHFLTNTLLQKICRASIHPIVSKLNCLRASIRINHVNHKCFLATQSTFMESVWIKAHQKKVWLDKFLTYDSSIDLVVLTSCASDMRVCFQDRQQLWTNLCNTIMISFPWDNMSQLVMLICFRYSESSRPKGGHLMGP